MRRLVLLVAFAACGNSSKEIVASKPQALPPGHDFVVDQRGATARMVPPEVFLRSFLVWFGNVSPAEVAARAREGELFDSWVQYLSTLGLPDYRGDMPRAEQTNAMMQATIGKLAEALCIRSAERDLAGRVLIADRQVFAFEAPRRPNSDDFEKAFDVLHRTFLGYPVALAPANRPHRFHALYQQVVARTADGGPLSPDHLAWAAVCTALVLHPEAELY